MHVIHNLKRTYVRTGIGATFQNSLTTPPCLGLKDHKNILTLIEDFKGTDVVDEFFEIGLDGELSKSASEKSIPYNNINEILQLNQSF